MTKARPPAGAPVDETTASRWSSSRSRPSAKSMRAATDAQPSPAPIALMIAARFSASAMPRPT